MCLTRDPRAGVGALPPVYTASNRGEGWKTTAVEVPEELLALLRQSRLGDRDGEEQVAIALAIHLFQEGLISAGKAAQLAGQPRDTFELLLGELGIPPVRYDEVDYDREWQAIQRARNQGA